MCEGTSTESVRKISRMPESNEDEKVLTTITQWSRVKSWNPFSRRVLSDVDGSFPGVFLVWSDRISSLDVPSGVLFGLPATSFPSTLDCLDFARSRSDASDVSSSVLDTASLLWTGWGVLR